MNNKGNFPDVVEWIRFALAFSLVFGITLAFIFNFDTVVQSADESVIPNVSKAASTSLKTAFSSGFDFLFLAVFLIFTSFSIMAARLIPSSPKFIIIAIFSLILLPFGALIAENIWDGFASNSTMSTVFGTLKFLPYMMDHLVYFVLFYTLAVGIALLSKEGSGVGGV